MIRVTGFYHWVEGAHFDHAYFNSEHGRVTREALSSLGLIGLECDQFISASTPQVGEIIATTNAYFPDLPTAQAALAKAGATLMADLPHYTNLKPEIRLSQVSVHV
jgi:hypothetical protein